MTNTNRSSHFITAAALYYASIEGCTRPDQAISPAQEFLSAATTLSEAFDAWDIIEDHSDEACRPQVGELFEKSLPLMRTSGDLYRILNLQRDFLGNMFEESACKIFFETIHDPWQMLEIVRDLFKEAATTKKSIDIIRMEAIMTLAFERIHSFSE